MTFRHSLLIALLAFFCVTAVSAEEAGDSRPGYWSGMMGGGWGSGMMGWGGNHAYGPGMMKGQGSGSGMMGGCGMMGYGRDAGGDDSYADGRIAFLKAELKITDSQNGAWNAYADALRSNSQVMVAMHKKMFDSFKQADHSAVAFLDFHIQAMKSRLAALEALKPATETLYKALSAEQRKKADDLIPVMGCM